MKNNEILCAAVGEGVILNVQIGTCGFWSNMAWYQDFNDGRLFLNGSAVSSCMG